AFLNAFFGTFVPKEVAFHIKLISLEVFCVPVRRQLPPIASQLPYWRDEAITTPGYRLNKPLSIGAGAQRLPQNRDVVSTVDLLDDCVGPDGFQQFILSQQMAVVFDQDEEQFEGFRLKRDAFSLAHH